MEDLETIREFLIESNENLVRLDQEIIELERDPQNPDLVASIFRTIHTIKGTCGFLGYDTLTRVSHAAETILSQVRENKRSATKQLINITLQSVDAIKEILVRIEQTTSEGDNQYTDLVQRLTQFAASSSDLEEAQLTAVSTPAAVNAEIPVMSRSGDSMERKIDSHFSESMTTAIVPEHEETVSREVEKAVTKTAAGAPVSESTVRVDVGLLDKLMNLVGELVLARNQVLQYSSRHNDAAFTATSQRLNLITSDLQEGVMKTRMQPIGIIWNKLPRVVRDLASELGKEIELVMDGADTELDRTIIEAIKDPLTHIVRNSCDHGIEMPADRKKKGKRAMGLLRLRAYHEGGHVNIEISDDGKGLNPEAIKAKGLQKGVITAEQAARMSDREAINIIFLPGFSTAEKVSNISGRGVGMDVVKTNIERIGGLVDLETSDKPGTTVKIKIPLTLAIIPGLIVSVGKERFVVPQMSLSELIRLEGEQARKQIQHVHGAPVFHRRGRLLPLIMLNRVLDTVSENPDSDAVNIVVVQVEGRNFGFVVDGINDTQEIVVKPLGKHLKGVDIYSGATIMGDGKVALILDVAGIAERSSVLSSASESSLSSASDEEKAAASASQPLLVFAAGSFDRLVVPLSLVARLEEIPTTHIERAAGRAVLQYRGEILPLIDLAEQLDGSSGLASAGENVQIVVFANGSRLVGLIVSRIIDIVDERVTVRRPSRHHLLLESGVIGQKIADFIDLQAILSVVGEDLMHSKPPRTDANVLVIERSSFVRGMLRSSLEVAGFRVLEAASAEQAMQQLQREPVQVVAASVEFENLPERIRGSSHCSNIPVLGLLSEEKLPSQAGSNELFHDYQSIFEREALVESLRKLALAVDNRSQPVAALKEL